MTLASLKTVLRLGKIREFVDRAIQARVHAAGIRAKTVLALRKRINRFLHIVGELPAVDLLVLLHLLRRRHHTIQRSRTAASRSVSGWSREQAPGQTNIPRKRSPLGRGGTSRSAQFDSPTSLVRTRTTGAVSAPTGTMVPISAAQAA